MPVLSVQQYADAAGIRREAVYGLIKRKRLPSGVTARRMGVWMLEVPDGFTPTKKRPGRPTK